MRARSADSTVGDHTGATPSGCTITCPSASASPVRMRRRARSQHPASSQQCVVIVARCLSSTRRAFVHSRIRRASIATCHQLPVMPKPRTVFRPVSASAAGAPTNGGGVGLEIGSRCATVRSDASALERLTADQRPKPDFSTPCKVCSVSARVPVPTEMVMRTSASLDE